MKHAEQNANASRNIVRFTVPATVIVVEGLLSAATSRGCRPKLSNAREFRTGFPVRMRWGTFLLTQRIVA
ncbi:hypothetical protein N9Z07_00915 [bacterium]|nr:hypothetical protein [bacterium]